MSVEREMSFLFSKKTMIEISYRNIFIYLTFLHCVTCQSCSEEASEFKYPKVNEMATVGSVVESVTPGNITGIEWIDSATHNTKYYFDLVSNDTIVAMLLKRELTNYLDCGHPQIDGNAIYGSWRVICSDGDSVDFTPQRVDIEPVNNRKPEFTEDSYLIQNVPILPANFNLGLFFQDLNILVQDLDRDEDEVQDKSISITIEDDPLGLLKVETSPATFTSGLCQGVEGIDNATLEATKVELILNKTIPDELQNSYTVKLVSEDSNGNRDTATFTMEFQIRDTQPPKFKEPFYWTVIDNPEFSSPKDLEIKPSSIDAVDGDEAISDTINFAIQNSGVCSESFEIADKSTAKIRWVQPLLPSCIEDGIFAISVQAYQVSNNKSAFTPVTVRIRDDKNPTFSQQVYHSVILKKTQALPDSELKLSDGPLYANSSNPLSTSTINYRLIQNGEVTSLFKIDSSNGIVTLSHDFDYDSLGQDGRFSLLVEAFEDQEPERKSSCEIVVTFQVDRYPPIFSAPSYTFHIVDPTFLQTMDLLNLTATDGDIDIGAKSLFEITSTTCSNCFKVTRDTGVFSWESPIPKDIIKERKTEARVKAYQEDDSSKFSEVAVTITFPGDELSPVFNSTSYNGQLLADGTINVDETISAYDPDTYLSDEITYLLSGDQGMFKIDSLTGQVSTSDQFDPAVLPDKFGKVVKMILKAEQKNDPNKVGAAELSLSYEYNSDPPTFNHGVIIIEVQGDTEGGAVLTTEGQLFAEVTTETVGVTIEYKLLDDIGGRFSLATFPDNSVKLTLMTSLDETLVKHDILTVEAFEKNAIPELSATANIVVTYILTETTTSSGSTSDATESTMETSQSTESTSSDTSSTSTTSGPCVSGPLTFEDALYETSINDSLISAAKLLTVKATTGCDSDVINYSISRVLPEKLENFFYLENGADLWVDFQGEFQKPQKIAVVIQAQAEELTAETVVSIDIVYVNDFEPEFVSGDFYSEDQDIGFPGFMVLESFIRQPVGNVHAIDSDRDALTYSIVSNTGDDSSKFYVDSLTGQMFIRETSTRTKFETLCPNPCKFEVEVTDGSKKSRIRVRVSPISEQQIIALDLKEDVGDAPESTVAKLNEEFAEKSIWFRMVAFRRPDAEKYFLNTFFRADPDMGTLFVTSKQKDDSFLSRDEILDLVQDSDAGDLVSVGNPVEVPDDSSGVNDPEDTGLFAAVIALAVVLSLVLVGAIGGVVFIRRRRMKNSFGQRSRIEPLTSSFKVEQPTSPTAPDFNNIDRSENRKIFSETSPESAKVSKPSRTSATTSEPTTSLATTTTTTSLKKKAPLPPSNDVTARTTGDKVDDTRNRKIFFNENAEVIENQKDKEVADPKDTEDDEETNL